MDFFLVTKWKKSVFWIKNYTCSVYMLCSYLFMSICLGANTEIRTDTIYFLPEQALRRCKTVKARTFFFILKGHICPKTVSSTLWWQKIWIASKNFDKIAEKKKDQKYRNLSVRETAPACVWIKYKILHIKCLWKSIFGIQSYCWWCEELVKLTNTPLHRKMWLWALF